MEEEKQTIVTEENPVKTKSKKGLVGIIIAIILLLAIVGGAAYYFMVYSKPENVFKRVVGKSVQSYESSIEESEYKTIKTRIGLNAKITPDEEDEETKEIVELINALDVALDVQMDYDQKQLLTKIESKYENENLLNLDLYVDVKDKEAYMYLKDMFDKYIETEMDDESYETLEELFENTYTKDQQASLKKAYGIIGTEFEKAIKTEYCSSEKQEITINGKTEKATKNTISMTYNQLCDEFITIFTNLKDNKEFIDCFEDSEEVTESLENAIEALEDEKDEKYNNTNIKISIYTTGILQNIVKVDFVVENEKQTATIEVNAKDKENYEFIISSGEEKITGNVNIKEQDENNAKLKIEVNVPEFGKVEVNFDITCELNGKMEEVDTSNSIAPDEITQSDTETITKNLQKSKLYELINKYSNGAIQSTMSSEIGSIAEDEDEDEEDEDIQIQENDEDEDEDSEELSTKDNEIITYNDEQKVEFNVPSGFEVSYKSDNYKSFMNDDISVKVTTQYQETDKYFKDIEETKEYFEEQEDYKDVSLSDVKTITVDGKEFSYRTLEYKYNGVTKTYNYRNMYICSKISDKNIFVVEIRDTGDMSESEIQEFLKIKVTDM